MQGIVVYLNYSDLDKPCIHSLTGHQSFVHTMLLSEDSGEGTLTSIIPCLNVIRHRALQMSGTLSAIRLERCTCCQIAENEVTNCIGILLTRIACTG